MIFFKLFLYSLIFLNLYNYNLAQNNNNFLEVDSNNEFSINENSLSLRNLFLDDTLFPNAEIDDDSIKRVIEILKSNIKQWNFIESQLLEPNVNLDMPELFIPLKHLTTTLEVLGNILYMKEDVIEAKNNLERACPLMELLPINSENDYQHTSGCFNLLHDIYIKLYGIKNKCLTTTSNSNSRKNNIYKINYNNIISNIASPNLIKKKKKKNKQNQDSLIINDDCGYTFIDNFDVDKRFEKIRAPFDHLRVEFNEDFITSLLSKSLHPKLDDFLQNFILDETDLGRREIFGDAIEYIVSDSMESYSDVDAPSPTTLEIFDAFLSVMAKVLDEGNSYIINQLLMIKYEFGIEDIMTIIDSQFDKNMVNYDEIISKVSLSVNRLTSPEKSLVLVICSFARESNISNKGKTSRSRRHRYSSSSSSSSSKSSNSRGNIISITVSILFFVGIFTIAYVIYNETNGNRKFNSKLKTKKKSILTTITDYITNNDMKEVDNMNETNVGKKEGLINFLNSISSILLYYFEYFTSLFNKDIKVDSPTAATTLFSNNTNIESTTNNIKISKVKKSKSNGIDSILIKEKNAKKVNSNKRNESIKSNKSLNEITTTKVISDSESSEDDMDLSSIKISTSYSNDNSKNSNRLPSTGNKLASEITTPTLKQTSLPRKSNNEYHSLNTVSAKQFGSPNSKTSNTTVNKNQNIIPSSVSYKQSKEISNQQYHAAQREIFNNQPKSNQSSSQIPYKNTNTYNNYYNNNTIGSNNRKSFEHISKENSNFPPKPPLLNMGLNSPLSQLKVSSSSPGGNTTSSEKSSASSSPSSASLPVSFASKSDVFEDRDMTTRELHNERNNYQISLGLGGLSGYWGNNSNSVGIAGTNSSTNAVNNNNGVIDMGFSITGHDHFYGASLPPPPGFGGLSSHINISSSNNNNSNISSNSNSNGGSSNANNIVNINSSNNNTNSNNNYNANNNNLQALHIPSNTFLSPNAPSFSPSGFDQHSAIINYSSSNNNNTINNNNNNNAITNNNNNINNNNSNNNGVLQTSSTINNSSLSFIGENNNYNKQLTSSFLNDLNMPSSLLTSYQNNNHSVSVVFTVHCTFLSSNQIKLIKVVSTSKGINNVLDINDSISMRRSIANPALWGLTLAMPSSVCEYGDLTYKYFIQDYNQITWEEFGDKSKHYVDLREFGNKREIEIEDSFVNGRKYFN
jgi:hypothetical protein